LPPVAVDLQKTAKITIGTSTNSFQPAIRNANAFTGPYRRLGILLDIGVRTIIESHIDDPNRRGAAGQPVAHHRTACGTAHRGEGPSPSLADLIAEYAADNRATNGTGSGTGSRYSLGANGFNGADPAFELGCGAAGLCLYGCGKRCCQAHAEHQGANQASVFHRFVPQVKVDI
jgi:hypothetical protein